MTRCGQSALQGGLDPRIVPKFKKFLLSGCLPCLVLIDSVVTVSQVGGQFGNRKKEKLSKPRTQQQKKETPEEKVINRPSIMVKGKATRQERPSFVKTKVSVIGKGFTREDAWREFQVAIEKLREALGTSATVENTIPSESSGEVSKGLRTVTEFSVLDSVTVKFTPECFGPVIGILINCDLTFSTPELSYEKVTDVPAELLADAAADARMRAAAVATGVEATLGRLVSITVGPPDIQRVLRTPMEFAVNFSTSMSRNLDLMSKTFFNDEQLPTYDTVYEVTVVYEIVEPGFEKEYR